MTMRELRERARTVGWDRFALTASGVFLVALLVRLLYLWELRAADVSYILVGDGYVYHEWARKIARGNWIGDTVFYQAPLYPYLLALLHALFGPSLLIVRMIQALLGATACLFLALAGRSFFSSEVGLLAGVLLALYSPAIFFDGLIQKAVLDLFLMTAFLGLLGRLLTGPPRWPWFAAAGVILGVLSLTRENAIVLVGVAGVWILVQFRQATLRARLVYVGLFVAGVGMALVPVGVRNQVVGGEFFLTTAQVGPNFFIGNNDRANGLYAPLRWARGDALREREDATQLAEAALGRKLTPGEVSRYWTQRTLAYIWSQPGHWLRLMGWKVLLTWNAQEVIDSEDPAVYADHSVVLRVLGRLVHFGTIVPFAVVGLWATWKDRARLWLLYLILVSITASVALFYVFARYRYPLVPVLVLFAAAGLVHAAQALRARRYRRLLVGLAILAASAVVVNRELIADGISRAVMYRNMGVTLAREGQLERAIGYYTRAVDAKPTYLEARLSLARGLAALGRRDEAIQQYREVLRLRPHLVDAEVGLRQLLTGGGGGEGPQEGSR